MRVLVVDDHPIMRLGLRQLLLAAPVVSGCSEAGNVADALALAQRERPDAIVVDTHEGADGAVSYALEQRRTLLHIGVRERALRLSHQGAWHDIADGDGPTPEAIRNVVAGALFAPEVVR